MRDEPVHDCNFLCAPVEEKAPDEVCFDQLLDLLKGGRSHTSEWKQTKNTETKRKIFRMTLRQTGRRMEMRQTNV
jgi:hypothetical protein